MRYKFPEKIEPKVGDERVVEKFLLFPKIINNEMRWFETVKILEKYIAYDAVWKDIRFVDDL